jgi:mono/diheme cytochrome c family protein
MDVDAPSGSSPRASFGGVRRAYATWGLWLPLARRLLAHKHGQAAREPEVAAPSAVGQIRKPEEEAMPVRYFAAIVAVALVAVLSPMAVRGDSEAGKALYAKWCQGCHGADGKGNPAMAKMLKTTVTDFRAIDLAKLSKADRAAKEAEFRTIIADGKRPMTGFGKKLSKEEQEAVLEYIETAFMKGAE